MKHLTKQILVMVVLVAGCAATPIQREMQYAIAIKQVQTQTISALDFNIMSAETGEAIQVGTRTATETLKRAVAARRDGLPVTVQDALLDAVLTAIVQVQAIIAKGEQ